LLNTHVSFAGSLPDNDLHALYECADLFLHPTLYEGSSLVTLEAMAHRLPVVASATGGLPDKVRTTGPEENGRLVPPGEVEALARAVSDIAALTPERRAMLGAASRARVERDYTWPQVARRLTALFEELRLKEPG
jgi:glycosyltransferase involved in cell wall biosynthesis